MTLSKSFIQLIFENREKYSYCKGPTIAPPLKFVEIVLLNSKKSKIITFNVKC